MKDEVRALLAQGLSNKLIRRKLGVSSATVSYHAGAMGLGKAPRPRRYDWDAIASDYASGMTMTRCRTKWGFSKVAWACSVKRGEILTRKTSAYIPLEDYLLQLSGREMTSCERSRVKTKMALEGVASECSECQLPPAWNGKQLNFHLDHVDGDNTNNVRANLRLLCPNCHSQTDTYGWRNAKMPTGAGFPEELLLEGA